MPDPVALHPVDSEAQARAETMALWYADPVLQCRQMLADWFPLPMPWLHRGILAIYLGRADFLLNFGEEQWRDGAGRWTKKKLAKIVKHFRYAIDPGDPASETRPIFTIVYGPDGRKPVGIEMAPGEHLQFIVPRGFSKTTLINAAVLIDTLYQECPFTLLISKSGPHAEAQLATIKGEMEANELLISIFGNLVPDRQSGEKWAGGEIETTSGVFIVAKGAGSQIRGMNRQTVRPWKIVPDDIEDEESVGTEQQRDKRRRWFWQSVFRALPHIVAPGQRPPMICILATRLHSEDLTSTIARDPRFTTVCFGAIDPDGDALWGTAMTLEKIERDKKLAAANGTLNAFYLEIMSTVRNEEAAFFNEDMWTYVNYSPEQAREKFVARAIAVDPAISTQPGADFFAIGVVGITDRGKKHVLDFFAKKGVHPDAQVDMYFELAMKWDCTHHGVEATAYQKALIFAIRGAMFAKAKQYGPQAYHDVTETFPGKSKEWRIEHILQRQYKAGYMTHNRRFADLESQLLDYPNGKRDGPDVIAACISLLEPFAATEYDEPGGLEKDSYKDEEVYDYREQGVP